MNSLSPNNLAQPTRCRQMDESFIKVCLAPNRYLLSNGRVAGCAISCVVRPAVGDLVLAASGEDDCYILHILAREEGGTATLSVPGAKALSIEQKQLSLSAESRLTVQSLQEMDLAAAGTLSLSSTNQFVHVAEALVENTDQQFSRSRICTQEASELLKVHGGQILLSAERDLRADAERICMG